MTTTLHDDRPAKASRSSCGFWRAATASPSVCYDAHGRGKGTCYGYRPGLTLAVAVATLSQARVSSTLARPWARLRRPARRLFQGVCTPPPGPRLALHRLGREHSQGPVDGLA
jgi:hypothetical protein